MELGSPLGRVLQGYQRKWRFKGCLKGSIPTRFIDSLSCKILAETILWGSRIVLHHIPESRGSFWSNNPENTIFYCRLKICRILLHTFGRLIRIRGLGFCHGLHRIIDWYLWDLLKMLGILLRLLTSGRFHFSSWYSRVSTREMSRLS